MNVEVKQFNSGIVLIYKEEEVLRALKWLKLRFPTDDLDVSLEVAWSLSRDFAEKEKSYLSMIQSIVTATKDGTIKPEDFDIFGLFRKIEVD